MKRRHLWAVLLAAAMLSGLLLGSGVLAVDESSPAELEVAQEVPDQTGEALVQEPTPAEDASLEKDMVTLDETVDLGTMLLLVNLWNPLPEQYTVKLEKLENGLQIAAEACPALEKMLSDCEAAGMDVTVCSAYRTEST